MPEKSQKFFIVNAGKKIPVISPEMIIPYLAAQEYHWREGYSAYELSYCWIEADSIPLSVQAVLSRSQFLIDANLVEGFFEYQVNLNTPGHASQTDLMAIIEAQGRVALLAVEGKVNEGFGSSVRKWNSTPGRDRRISLLCDVLGLFYDDLARLKYQLVHRTASAVLEAQRRGIPRATVVIHTFDPSNSHFYDFQCFCDLLTLPVQAAGQISEFKTVGGVELALAWVSDVPRSSRLLQSMPGTSR